MWSLDLLLLKNRENSIERMHRYKNSFLSKDVSLKYFGNSVFILKKISGLNKKVKVITVFHDWNIVASHTGYVVF